MWFTGCFLLATSTLCVALGFVPNQLPSVVHKLGLKPPSHIYDSDESDDIIIKQQSSSTVKSGSSNVSFNNGFNDAGYSKQSFTKTSSTSIQIEGDSDESDSLQEFVENIGEDVILSNTNTLTGSLTPSMSDLDILSERSIVENNLQENILMDNSEIISDMISSTVEEDITLPTISDQINMTEMEDIIEVMEITDSFNDTSNSDVEIFSNFSEITESNDTTTLSEIEENLEMTNLINNGPILPMHNAPSFPGHPPGMGDVFPPNMMKPKVPGSMMNSIIPPQSNTKYLPDHILPSMPRPQKPYPSITPPVKMPPIKPEQLHPTGYIPPLLNSLPKAPPGAGSQFNKPVSHLPEIPTIPSYSMPAPPMKKSHVPYQFSPPSSSILPPSSTLPPIKKPFAPYQLPSPSMSVPPMKKPYGPYQHASLPSMTSPLPKYESMMPFGEYSRSPRMNPFLQPQMWKQQMPYLPTTASETLTDVEYFTETVPGMNGLTPKLPWQNYHFMPGMNMPGINMPGIKPQMWKQQMPYLPTTASETLTDLEYFTETVPGMNGLTPKLPWQNYYFTPGMNTPGVNLPGMNTPGMNFPGMNTPPYIPKYPINTFNDIDETSEYFFDTRNYGSLNSPYMKNIPLDFDYSQLDILDSNYDLKYPYGPQSKKYPVSLNTNLYPIIGQENLHPTSRNLYKNLGTPFWPYFGSSQPPFYQKPPHIPTSDYPSLPSGMPNLPYHNFPKPKMPIPMNQPGNSPRGVDLPSIPQYPPLDTTFDNYPKPKYPSKLPPGITPGSYPQPLHPPKLPPSGIIPGTYPKPLYPPKLPPSGTIPGSYPKPLYPPKLPPSEIIPGSYPKPLHPPKLPPSGIIPGSYPKPLHPPKFPPEIIPGSYPKPLHPPKLHPSEIIPGSYPKPLHPPKFPPIDIIPGDHPHSIYPPSGAYPLDISYLIDEQLELYTYFDAILTCSCPAALIAAKELSDAGKRVLLISGGSYPPPESYSLYLRPQILTQPNLVKTGPINIPGAFSPKKFVYPTFLGGYSEVGFNNWDYGTKQKNQQWGSVSPAWNWQNIVQLFEAVELIPGEIDAEGIIPVNRNLPRTQTIEYISSALQDLGLSDLGTEYSLRDQPGSMMLPVMAEEGRHGLQAVSFAEEVLEDMNNPENVFLSLNTQIESIDVLGDRAMGVTIKTPSGQKHAINAQDIIIGGNPGRTAQLLYQAGLGDEMVLDRLGIPTQQHLPAVGKHWTVNPMFTGSFFTFPQGSLKELGTSDIEAKEEFLQGQYGIQSGILLDHFKAFISIQDGFQSDVVINFYAFTKCMVERLNALMEGRFQFNDATQMYIRDLLQTSDILFAMPELMDTKSQGEIVINSRMDLHFPPTLDSGMYTNPQDMLVMLKALQFVESLGETPTFQMLGANYMQISVDGCVGCRSFEMYNECVIRNLSVPGLYSSGGAIMGTNSLNSVVNQNLLVHGMENLYIMNSAVIPNGIGAQESVATESLIGEYGANYILKKNSYL